MNIPELNNLIQAYECGNGPYGGDCQNCPYGYGHYDDISDSPFWTCDDEKWEAEAVHFLKLYQYLAEGKNL